MDLFVIENQDGSRIKKIDGRSQEETRRNKLLG